MCMICQSRVAMTNPEFAERGITFAQSVGNVVALSREATLNELGDTAGNTTTNITMQVGDTVRGSISSTSDQDWFRISLEAGQTYVFMVWGRDASLGMSDPYLRVISGNGNVLGQSDDAAPQFDNYFSALEFTAQLSGTYYLAVQGSPSAITSDATGRYILQAASNVFTLDQIASYLTDFDWGLNAPLRFDVSTGGTITANISGLTADGKQLARWAFEAWTIATGLQFQETTSANAMIILDDEQGGAVAGPSAYNPVNMIMSQSDVNIGRSWLDEYGTELDSYSFLTYMHEIGHALGLGHPGPYDGNAVYGFDNLYLNDSVQTTIMSYFDPGENTFVTGDSVSIVTPMIADLIAMHKVYGAPQAYQGNTTWGANSNVGGYLGALFGYVFDGSTPNANLYSGEAIGWTIYDTSGDDTLDFSTVAAEQIIDMRQEGVSSVGGSSGNMVIARGTVIENAIGGRGNDRIIGNAADNVIEGGLGNDTINGGAGNDTAVLRVNIASVTATQISNGGVRIQSAQGVDEYSSIENFRFNDGTFTAAQVLNFGVVPDSILIGTNGPDTLIGTDGNDSIEGRGGDDVIAGGLGNDSLYGGDGNDEIAASDGNDLVYGDAGNDNIGGGLGDDTIYGGVGDDTVGGGRGSDLIYGGTGNDGLYGGADNDTIYGGDGDDDIGGGFGNDSVEGGVGNDNMGGGSGRDIIRGGDGNDSIGGGFGDDLLYGDTGNDFIAGGAGRDTVYGGDGNDVINGGAGDDVMYGEAGRDVFVFNDLVAGEIDLIMDFENGRDTIRMRGVGSGSQQDRFDALSVTTSGSATVIKYDGHTIRLEGFEASLLDRTDFLFL